MEVVVRFSGYLEEQIIAMYGNGSRSDNDDFRILQSFLENAINEYIGTKLVIEYTNTDIEPIYNVDILKLGKSCGEKSLEDIMSDLENGKKIFFDTMRVECVSSTDEANMANACSSMVKVGGKEFFPMLSTEQSIKIFRDVSLSYRGKYPTIDFENRIIVKKIPAKTTMKYYLSNDNEKVDFKIEQNRWERDL